MKWIGPALLVAAVALLLSEIGAAGLCLQDDSYISMRYATHLAEGDGLVFNAGERVEGITNLLWTVLLAVPLKLGLEPVFATRLLGAAGGCLALGAVYLLGARLSGSEGWPAGVAAFVAALLPVVVAESAMGLETYAFAAVVILALVAATRPDDDGAGSFSPLLCGLSFWLRPEGASVGFLLASIELVELRRAGRLRLGNWFMRWSIFGALVAGLTLFRWIYFGALVPNTFHAKVGGGWGAVPRGLSYLWEFAGAHWPLLIIGAAALGAALSSRESRRVAIRIAALLVVFIAYTVYVGGDYKPSFRFFAVPLLLLTGSLPALSMPLNRRIGARAGAWMLASVALGAALLSVPAASKTQEFVSWRRSQIPMQRAAAEWLAKQYPAGTLLATDNAGLIPFYTRFPTIDMLGLCDATIARRRMPGMGTGLAGHEKGDGAYVLRRAPRLILFELSRFSEQPLSTEQAGRMIASVGERELWESAEFQRSYQFKRIRLPGFYFHYFEKKEQL